MAPRKVPAAMAEARFPPLPETPAEEKIRTNRGPKDRNDGKEKVTVERECWNKCRDDYFTPGNLKLTERHRNIIKSSNINVRNFR